MTSQNAAITGVSTTTTPGQGASTLYHGPWRHEKQTLSVQYVRVPEVSNQTSHVLNLSAYTPSAPIGKSNMLWIVNADYQIMKTTLGYSASTPFVQPQTFSLQPVSAGPEGTAYYPLPNAASGHWGPAGQIITTSAFEDRRLWQTSDDGTEVHQTCEGGNFAFYTLVSGTNYQNYNWPLLQYWTQYEAGYIWPGEKYIPRKHAGFYANTGDPFLHKRLGSYYNIYGPYTTEKEIYGMVFVGQMLDIIGNHVKASNYTTLNPANSAKNLHNSDISEGCSLYNIARHQY